MSTDLTQAVADVRQAETQAATIAQILAVVQAAQAAVPAPAACSCSTHAAPAPRRSAGKTAAWIGGAAVCGCVLTGLFLAIALTAIAVTVGGCVSYLLIRQIRKGK
jgi:ferric-dicitrate binding protein FerR (iron transport regulator)